MALSLFLPHLFKTAFLLSSIGLFFVVPFYTSANALYFSKIEDKPFMFPSSMMIRN